MDNHTYAALPPVANAIVIGGETIDLTPIRVGEIPAFSCAIRPVVAGLADLRPDWILLISEHGDAVIDAVAIATRRPREWVAGLELDDAVRLASAVFEVNADFFIRRLLPSLTAAAARIEARMPGLMQSSA
jgi:hypothetical protein